MRYLTLLFCLSLSVPAVSSSYISIYSKQFDDKNDTVILNRLPRIGEVASKSLRSVCKGQLLTNSNQTSPFAIVLVDSITFEISWNERNNRINYISTTDTNFITQEKVRVNTSLKQVREIQEIEIINIRGWGFFIKLKSGWSIGFCVGKSCTDRNLLDTDLVKWIFKN